MADEHSTQSPELSYLNLGGPVFTFKEDLGSGDYLDAMKERLELGHAMAMVMTKEDFQCLDKDLQRHYASGLAAMLREVMIVHDYMYEMPLHSKLYGADDLYEAEAAHLYKGGDVNDDDG